MSRRAGQGGKVEFCLSPRESEAFTTDHPQPILEIFRILSQLSEKSELAPFSVWTRG